LPGVNLRLTSSKRVLLPNLRERLSTEIMYFF